MQDDAVDKRKILSKEDSIQGRLSTEHFIVRGTIVCLELDLNQDLVSKKGELNTRRDL